MTLLRCATHVVRDLDAAVERFADWLDYSVVESGALPDDLASAWRAPASAGRRYAVMRPASGAEVYLRFVEGDVVEAYRPIRSYGWAAIEICVQDVLAVNERMLRSPFEVIGPPTPIEGFPTIHPMQVRGPDLETVYLTEITVDGPKHGLPAPKTLIDRPFILVLACADLVANARWFQEVLALQVSDPVAIRYSMIAQAFELPPEQLHEIVTCKWEGETFLELDQYPETTVKRPRHPGALPPGVALCTMVHPQFDRFERHWISTPTARSGSVYQGRRVGVLETPDGALLEIVEGAA
jgi:catechol 2,3-dioxygenase-like lactoylglutathione lyase family enzyme